MKKIFVVTVFIFAILVPDTFAQTLLNVNRYFSYFPLQRGQDITDNDYVWLPTNQDYETFMILGGKEDWIDTPLEFALLSYYSQPVLNIRPSEANAILPANNPRLADQKLGASVFQEIQILRFLGDTAAVNRHEAVLQFITGRGNATRAEIETFYRNNIRALVSGVVDEEFNKVSFLLENYSTNSRFSYNAVLTRNNQNGQYTLNYERPDIANDDKTLYAASLEALSTAMRNSGDFVPAAINTVRAQAALIPAVAYSSSDIQTIKNEITNLFLTPNRENFDLAVRRYRTLRADGSRGSVAKDSFYDVVKGLNPELAMRVVGR